jgi:2-polyprenyl-3-methyl-5-hydroxy-6-metoxy-1,4-benzoquinol methylase
MNCRICKANKIITKYKNVAGYKINRSFSIKECLNCGVCFTDPFLNSKEYKKYHNAHQVVFNGAGKDSDVDQYLEDKDLEWEKLGYATRLKNIIDIKPNMRRVLDVGCGAGIFLDYLKNKGFYVEGVELSPWGYNIAKNRLGLKIHNNLIENLTPPSNKFDVITLYDVLEHTTNPNDFLITLKKWLKKDGVVIINLPNIDSMISNSTKDLWNKLCPPDHTFHFNNKSISYLLNKNGYNPISITTNSGNPGESLGQLAVGTWRKVGGHNKAVAKSLKMLNKPYSSNKSLLLALIKGTRVVGNRMGFFMQPYLRRIDKKAKGEGLNIVCNLYQ